MLLPLLTLLLGVKCAPPLHIIGSGAQNMTPGKAVMAKLQAAIASGEDTFQLPAGGISFADGSDFLILAAKHMTISADPHEGTTAWFAPPTGGLRLMVQQSHCPSLDSRSRRDTHSLFPACFVHPLDVVRYIWIATAGLRKCHFAGIDHRLQSTHVYPGGHHWICCS
jgi:hypothetical protein